MSDKTRILFLCTGNSCRSQMAEGFCRALLGDHFHAFSAGIEMHGLNPLAVRAMREVGIDLSRHYSKTVEDPDISEIDVVATVCDNASDTCPIFPARVSVLHHSFDDPPKLATMAKDDDAAMVHYRRVRDQIKLWVETLPGIVDNARSATGTRRSAALGVDRSQHPRG